MHPNSGAAYIIDIGTVRTLATCRAQVDAARRRRKIEDHALVGLPRRTRDRMGLRLPQTRTMDRLWRSAGAQAATLSRVIRLKGPTLLHHLRR